MYDILNGYQSSSYQPRVINSLNTDDYSPTRIAIQIDIDIVYDNVITT